jgi:hypothetical protein
MKKLRLKSSVASALFALCMTCGGAGRELKDITKPYLGFYECESATLSGENLIEQFDLTNSFIRYSGVGTANANGGSIDFLFNGSSTNIEIEVKNIYIIDLTTMYGEGHEPTAEQCNELFTLQYYPYNTGELLTINYLDGYNLGKNEGYDEGVSYQATQQLTSDGWIKNIFTGIIN